MGSRALDIADLTAVMACSSSDSETVVRAGFKRGKCFLNSSGSEEEDEKRTRKSKRLTNANKEYVAAVDDEDKEKNSSEDEMPTRGRFRKAEREEHTDELESSSSMESEGEARKKRRRSKRQMVKKKETEESDEDSEESSSSTDNVRRRTRSMKIPSEQEDEAEESTDDLEEESDGNVKMSRKSNACVISSSSDDDDGSGSNIENETKMFEVKTKTSFAKFDGRCSQCGAQFSVGRTSIIGVFRWDGEQFVNKEGSREDRELFWICAKHSSFTKPKKVERHLADQDEEEDEANSDDEDFIDDSEYHEDQSEGSSFAEEKKKLLQSLKRETPNDKMNRSKYMEEQSKYQLEIHTVTNRGLHLSPEKRLKRNLRTAGFDKGLKQDRGLGCQDPEYGVSKDVTIDDGTRIRIFPQTIKRSHFSQFCSLEGCDKRFENGTEIIGVMLPKDGRFQLNDRGKLFYICCNHVYTDDLT